MHQAYKFRLDPTKKQATLMNKCIDCSRFVYNHFWAKWNEAYEATNKGLTYNACSKQLTTLKKELEWLIALNLLVQKQSCKES
ncbi:helix-turn-helix domain-containing protein [Hazenella coriacea]|uniref:Helix-turn-helix protein n=1 Tax=Hazenella coriacea TaxID=1179467 RepID=A0A4R3L0D5_9BACL|nr:helix-turn-helix protein [Hazenella coriacea]